MFKLGMLSLLATYLPLAFILQQAFGQTTIRFAAIGDYGYAGTHELAVANLVKSWNPDFIITMGDNNYVDGADSTIDINIGQYYHEFIGNYTGSYGSAQLSGFISATLYEINRFFPSLGNHDWEAVNAQPYLDYFTLPGAGIPTSNTSGNERYYDFIRGPVHFFAIDSDSHEPDGRNSASTQAQWLQTQLAVSSTPWKIVYMHHPPFSSGNNGPHTTLQWPYQQWGATAVLGGHDHVYERIDKNGLLYFINGLGGRSKLQFVTIDPDSKKRYRDDYGAMLIEASNTNINFNFYSVNTNHGDNGLIDSYTISKPGLVFNVERTTGTVYSTGTFTGGGADVAEHIRVSEPVEPGDVVELNPDQPMVYRKARGNSELVAGIIATEPGFILGTTDAELIQVQESGKRPMLTLVGRVPVKATIENGVIQLGDLLTVSSKPGYAMRCTEIKDCEGAIIGKALESLVNGEGLILVLLMIR